MLSNFFTSFYQSRFCATCLAGMGATLCIFLIAQGAQLAPEYLGIMAPFGATMVILFALPKSPLAQPKNILGGHLLTTCIGLITLQFWDITPFTMALSVGLGVSLMMLTNTLHPPAGANPLVVLSLKVSWGFLFSPVLSGCLLIILFGWFYHNWISRIGYPLKTKN
ncbi:MAG: HPP family protein [Oceanospirillaceae bacterium]|nr:HPP family protein [Oceanospirillaceae bacterium]